MKARLPVLTIMLVTISLNLIAIQTVNRALSINALLSKKYTTLKLSEPWYQAFDEPEDNGVWFVWGQSGNGKTSFMWQMVKELSNHGRVVYNSMEEGAAKTVQNTVRRTGLSAEERRRIILVHESMEELTQRLRKQKSPKFIFIDSWQYTGLSWEQYLEFKKAAEGKLIIILSHADGRKPAGRTADRIKYDASLKIWVEGYHATSQGRYIGPNGGTYVIWPEAAAKHWGNINNTNQDAQ